MAAPPDLGIATPVLPPATVAAPAGPAFTAPPSAPVAPTAAIPAAADMTMNDFLDRLMMAESGGRSDARNPRSTAVGPYQFIERTWLDLAQRTFPVETQSMTPAQILALRTNLAFARRGAETFTKDNAAVLKANGLDATFPRLRLAFLLGPQGAVRVLQAAPQIRVTAVLGPGVAKANPFMYGMTVEALIARAARDLAVRPTSAAGIAAADIPAGVPPKPRALRVAVQCNLALAACRRWQQLAAARLSSGKAARRQVASARGR